MSNKKDKWQELENKLNLALEEWRRENPEATLTEIENAVDYRISQIRTQMVQDLAQDSRQAQVTPNIRPACPQCNQPVVANGTKRRKLKTEHDRIIHLERYQAYCQRCNLTFFPPR